ncbi:MAG: GldG family protein [Maricaulaceae bacterium]|nr:GldG family protein [Maricaulaceae bacterium]
MTRRAHLLAMLAAILALAAGANLIAGTALRGARLDMTELGLYRLSPGARDAIADIDEPVRWTFYYSRRAAADYPAVRAYGARVREMLRAFAAASGGRIRLTETDPAPYSQDEDSALAAGLQPLEGGAGERIFFGLVMQDSVDERRVIARFASEREALLEYELVRALSDLRRPRQPVLAVLTGLPIVPGAPRSLPSRAAAALEEAYDVRWLEPGFLELPDDADALFILHPPRLDAAQLYLVDQFALRRGRVIAALDPMAHVALRPGPDGLPPPAAQRASGLGALTAAWGALYDPQIVVMDRSLGLPVQVVEDGRARLRAYPLWFSAGPAERPAGDVATAGLTRGINFGSPGALAPAPGAAAAFVPLVTASPDGALIEADFAAQNPSPDALLRGYQPAEAPPVIAARLRGEIRTAFPDGPPAGAETLFDPGAHLARSAAPADIALVADADWLDDPFYTRADAGFGAADAADNLSFLLNLTDLALGDAALIGLRSRAASARPMRRVEALRAAAEARYVEEQAGLEERIGRAEERLRTLLGPGGAPPPPGEEGDAARAEIETLRAEVLTARNRLREVERDFRADIDRLEAGLRFWTIWFPPLAVAAAGAGMALWRRRRRAAP